MRMVRKAFKSVLIALVSLSMVFTAKDVWNAPVSPHMVNLHGLGRIQSNMAAEDGFGTTAFRLLLRLRGGGLGARYVLPSSVDYYCSSICLLVIFLF